MKTTYIHIEHGENSVEIPCIEIQGHGEGPSAFVSGGMHGNEINGIAIARRLLEHVRHEDLARRLRGRLVVLPVLNPSGFGAMQRRVLEDDRDLNRSFGFDEPDTLSQQIASGLCEAVFRHCQFGIDLHDAGGRAVLLPHSRVHTSDEFVCHRSTHDMARLFGTDIVVERPGKRHMMAIDLHRRFDMPVLTVEIGGGQRLYEHYFERAVRGILSVISAYGMLDAEIHVPERQFLLDDRYGVKVAEPCEVRMRVALGAQVHAGDELGDLYFPRRNRRETLRSTMCGIVFSLWDRGQAPEGATLYSVLEHETCHVERTTLDRFKLLPELSMRRIKM